MAGFQTLDAGLGSAADADSVRRALWSADTFGLPGAAPALRANLEELQDQAGAVRTEVLRRHTAVQAIDKAIAALPPEDDAPDPHVRAQLERLQAVFGPAFRALPLLGDADPTAAAVIRGAFSDERTPADDSAQIRGWLARAARIRSRAAVVRDLDTYHAAVAEAAPDVERAQLSAAQLPHVPGEAWAAEASSVHGGRVSIISYQPLDDPWDDAIAGVMLDEWTEVVPSAEQTTSVAFHADAPTSAPPQSLLIAAPHPGIEEWSADIVMDIVDEAMRVAKLRAVTPVELGVNQFLPVLIGATDPQFPTIGLDGSRLTQPS